MCKGGKKSKQRFTVAFFVNAAGGKNSRDMVAALSCIVHCYYTTPIIKCVGQHTRGNFCRWQHGNFIVLHGTSHATFYKSLGNGQVAYSQVTCRMYHAIFCAQRARTMKLPCCQRQKLPSVCWP